MQMLLDAVKAGENLSPVQVQVAVSWLANPEAGTSPKGLFLEALHQKGETAEEIAAFAKALLALAVTPQLDKASLPGPTIDVCGTGGDRLELFNISTASMFLLAAGGAVVVKHGNRAVTSQCGGADVLEALGVRIELSPEELSECVKRHGLGFLFAPRYHPAFRTIGPVRRGLADRGIATVFNLLGPLLNPVRPDYQLVGVYDAELLPRYGEALAQMGRKRAWAVHGSGADELTLAGPAQGIAVEGGKLSKITIHPAHFGLPHASVEKLRGGGKKENALILEAILSGKDNGPRAQAVALNAAAGFVITGLAKNMSEGLEKAVETLQNGQALAKLKSLQSL
ncbi:MAG: anthranilate phosphoribosyltransferase [Verrucomicrobiota bacterium]|jgi:anthranilate phosphoribosyltransferase